MGGADHVIAVADADAGGHLGAVGQDEGVVVGGQAGGGDLAADLQVLHVIGGGDVAVDEHPGDLTLAVADQDGLH